MLANITHSFRMNSTIALLQPPPEVIDLFDDIILLSEGTVVYHVRFWTLWIGQRVRAGALAPGVCILRNE